MNTMIMNEMVYSLHQINGEEYEFHAPSRQQLIGAESVLMWCNWSGRMDDDGRWEPSYLEEVWEAEEMEEWRLIAKYNEASMPDLENDIPF